MPQKTTPGQGFQSWIKGIQAFNLNINASNCEPRHIL